MKHIYLIIVQSNIFWNIFFCKLYLKILLPRQLHLTNKIAAFDKWLLEQWIQIKKLRKMQPGFLLWMPPSQIPRHATHLKTIYGNQLWVLGGHNIWQPIVSTWWTKWCPRSILGLQGNSHTQLDYSSSIRSLWASPTTSVRPLSYRRGS